MKILTIVVIMNTLARLEMCEMHSMKGIVNINGVMN